MFTTEMQYVVVRYMLNDLADEASNIGLIAVTEDPPRVFSRFLSDPSVKSRQDARIRKDIAERFAAYASTEIHRYNESLRGERGKSADLFQRLTELGANLVRVNLPRSVLTSDVSHEFELLFDQLVAPLPSSSSQKAHLPRDPLRALRREATKALIRAFREGYGQPLSRKTFLRGYEVRGASHKNTFDLAILGGSRKRRREHLYQHLLQLPDPEESFTQTAALCWRWQDIKQANHADRTLTAFLYERPDQPARGISETTKLLRHEDIEVADVATLPRLVSRLERQGQLFRS